MQTFIPFTDFQQSIQCLDTRRLNKQITECRQILDVLTGRSQTSGWRNHPAVRMWAGHEGALAAYGLTAIDEWRKRGYTSHVKQQKILRSDLMEAEPGACGLPRWWGTPEVHHSHRANLLRKDPTHYGPLFETDLQPMEGYIWP